MIERKYRITINGGVVVAESMTLTDALILIEALFNKYSQDTGIKYTISMQINYD